MISLAPERRHASTSSPAPGNAAPSHGFCSSQNSLKLFRGVGWTVSRSDLGRNEAATAAGLVGSATYVHLEASPALTLANMLGTVLLLPSSLICPKCHT